MQNTGIEIFYLYDAMHGNSDLDTRYKFTAKEHEYGIAKQSPNTIENNNRCEAN
jgi:hypothetical protein